MSSRPLCTRSEARHCHKQPALGTMQVSADASTVARQPWTGQGNTNKFKDHTDPRSQTITQTLDHRRSHRPNITERKPSQRLTAAAAVAAAAVPAAIAAATVKLASVPASSSLAGAKAASAFSQADCCRVSGGIPFHAGYLDQEPPSSLSFSQADHCRVSGGIPFHAGEPPCNKLAVLLAIY